MSNLVQSSHMKQIQEFVKNIFNIDNDTSATILITLTVFILGILMNQLFQIYIGYSRRRIVRKMFLLNVKELSIKVKEQSNEYFAFSKQFSLVYRGGISLHKVNIPQLSIIKEFGYLTTFKGFFSGLENQYKICGLRKKAYNKIWDSVSTLEFWQADNLSLSYFNENNKLYNNQRNHALQNFQTLLESNLNFDNINHPNPKISGYYREADGIISRWQVLADNTRPDVIHNELVVKIRELNKHTEHSVIPIIIQLNNYLLEASLHYENLRLLFDVYEQHFKLLGHVFKKHHAIVKKCGKILS